MFWAAIIVSFALAPDSPALTDKARPGQIARLELVANTTTILQRDPLFLISLVHNASTDIHLLREAPQTGDYVALFMRVEGEWRRIPTMEKTRAPNKDREGGKKGRAVLSHSSYAEYHAIHRDADAFLFDEPGKYELKAVARTANGELTSKTITVTVEPRLAKDLKRIAAAGKQLDCLEFLTLRWKLPAEIKALEDVGGNIGIAVKYESLLQDLTRSEKIEGREIPWDQLADFFKKHFDSVCWKFALERFASNYIYGAPPHGRSQVAQAMPHDSLWRRELRRHVRVHTSENRTTAWMRQDFGGEGDQIVESD